MKYKVIYQEAQKIFEFELISDDDRIRDEIHQIVVSLGGTPEKRQYLSIQKIDSEG